MLTPGPSQGLVLRVLPPAYPGKHVEIEGYDLTAHYWNSPKCAFRWMKLAEGFLYNHLLRSTAVPPSDGQTVYSTGTTIFITLNLNVLHLYTITDSSTDAAKGFLSPFGYIAIKRNDALAQSPTRDWAPAGHRLTITSLYLDGSVACACFLRNV